MEFDDMILCGYIDYYNEILKWNRSQEGVESMMRTPDTFDDYKQKLIEISKINPTNF